MYICVQLPRTYVFICIADTINSNARIHGNRSTITRSTSVVNECCNEITKSRFEGARSPCGNGKGKYREFRRRGFSQIVQSRRSKWSSPRDHKTDDRALKWRLIASRPLGKHIVGKLCFPCWFAIRFFEIYRSEIGGALITLAGIHGHSRLAAYTVPSSMIPFHSLREYSCIRIGLSVRLSIWCLPQKRLDEVVEP